jgi:hypothetical protein
MQPYGSFPAEGAAYSPTGHPTEMYVSSDITGRQITESMYHELVHVDMGDFGRSAAKGVHGAPGVAEAIAAAEQEALKNSSDQ